MYIVSPSLSLERLGRHSRSTFSESDDIWWLDQKDVGDKEVNKTNRDGESNKDDDKMEGKNDNERSKNSDEGARTATREQGDQSDETNDTRSDPTVDIDQGRVDPVNILPRFASTTIAKGMDLPPDESRPAAVQSQVPSAPELDQLVDPYKRALFASMQDPRKHWERSETRFVRNGVQEDIFGAVDTPLGKDNDSVLFRYGLDDEDTCTIQVHHVRLIRACKNPERAMNTFRIAAWASKFHGTYPVITLETASRYEIRAEDGRGEVPNMDVRPRLVSMGAAGRLLFSTFFSHGHGCRHDTRS